LESGSGANLAVNPGVFRVGLSTRCLLFAALATACGTTSRNVVGGDSGADVFIGGSDGADAADGGNPPDGNDGAPDVARCTGPYINGGEPCATEGSLCIECEQGVGIGCTCAAAPYDGGTRNQWLCVGTEHPCPWM
jgi:hypothetical protein